jgi:hypothetical protein
METKAEGNLVATVVITSSNIYVLSEIGNEKCCLAKKDEVGLWYKRMGHINFDNLAKVSSSERNSPEHKDNQHFMQALSTNKENKDKVQIKGILNDNTTRNCAYSSSWNN